MPDVIRSRMRSPYMEWAKRRSQARYNLAASGMPSYTLAEFCALTGVRLEDIELTSPGAYGYDPLQQALAAKAGVEPDCVVAAAGTSLANHLAMAATFQPGDEVLIERPTYELLVSAAQYLGATVRRFERRFEEGFQLNPREVERALTPRTRLIAVTNLHNPSSALTADGTLREIGELARSVGATVLVDEVYLEACYAAPWRSAFHLGNHFVVTSSLTKAYGLSGLRCGWVLAEPALARAMWRLNDLYGVNAAHPAERLSVVAIAHLPALAVRHRTALERNRQAVQRFLDARPDLQAVTPAHGTVLFPRLRGGNVEDFCRLLRERYETSVVPGSFFEAPQHFRMFLGAETASFSEGLLRLGAALDEHASATPRRPATAPS
ncbi:MAG TPA: aminotransferase class I/II-fold pyridoxal phosphate-dependent enzyme [Terriglobia bacterium]|nr:aminotransferase class I/II-fold pyridoxal phosphate-dependent enzyme [Terriglobia bacterium]